MPTATPQLAPAKRDFLGALHGLRGLLAVWVLVFHVSPTLPGASHGHIAVDVFFVLSGYVLMYSHSRDLAHVSWAGAGAFLHRRIWRTIPLHACCLLLAVIVYVLVRRALPTPLAFVQSALLLEGWAARGLAMNTPLWSLGVEWIGYLAFPLIVALTMRGRSAFVLVGVIVAVLVAELTLLQVGAARGWRIGVTSDGFQAVVRMAGGFLAGCLLWRVHSLRRWAASDWVMAAAVVGGAAVLSRVTLTLAVLPFLVLLVHAAAKPGQWTRACLEHPVALFLGRISFSLYLSHFLILMLATRIQGDRHTVMVRLLVSGSTYVCALAVATILCVKGEEPARRWRAGRRTRAEITTAQPLPASVG